MEGEETKISFKKQIAFKGINAVILNAEMIAGRKEYGSENKRTEGNER